MTQNEIRAIVDAKYSGYVDRIVSKLRVQQPDLHELGSIAIDSRASGDDSPWPDVWEEYKVQIQGEHSFCFEAYEDTIYAMCEQFIGALAHPEIQLLWLGSDASDKWECDEREGQPAHAAMCEGVADELLRRVRGLAARGESPADHPS